jgi:hypothetical protein
MPSGIPQLAEILPALAAANRGKNFDSREDPGPPAAEKFAFCIKVCLQAYRKSLKMVPALAAAGREEAVIRASLGRPRLPRLDCDDIIVIFTL